MPTNQQSNSLHENILVVGGAGYIGSHMTKYLRRAGYNAIVFDNLSTGHREQVLDAELIVGDIFDENLLRDVFRKHSITAVMHFAGFIQVNESVIHPEKYYQNNVVGTLHLLSAMRKANVKNIVFSSTAAVYGNPLTNLITETHPLAPINPYGRSKLIVETLLQDYAKSYGFNVAALRYFNAAGCDPEGQLNENHIPETHLIPLLLHAANFQKEFTVFGNDYETPDGSCIRDFIHVNDLCEAHLLALKKLETQREDKMFFCNLGTGKGHSVLDVVRVVEGVTNANVTLHFSARRAGDPAILVADPSKAHKELNWQPILSDLSTIVRHACCTKRVEVL